MAPKNRIIIDTDPGVDDVLALLLALSASPEDLEVAMISVTYGNVPLQRCLRNVVALFHVLEKEMAWRKSKGLPTYGALEAYKPIVAVGAEHALEDEQLVADHFHGADGLHGVHDKHPHLSPAETWRTLFEDSSSVSDSSVEPPSYSRRSPRTPSPSSPSAPLTNVALAASEDPETFLRVKELVVMGGAVHVEGNVGPYSEFNCMADAVAAARVYALTSQVPSANMPPAIHGQSFLPPYPERLSRQLKLTLFPLDITTPHELRKRIFNDRIQPLIAAGSPLAQWTETFMNGTFDKIDSMLGVGHDEGLSLHDPLCVCTVQTNPEDPMDAVTVDEVPGDTMGWLSVRKANRINRMLESPGQDIFADVLLKQVFA
ncbi:hypothetical protein N0V88_004581 [Collariella sp. IMI 366227]|nr:hypothetical protein N0V88_004581 [Collariella sp. IMI 366227]